MSQLIRRGSEKYTHKCSEYRQDGEKLSRSAGNIPLSYIMYRKVKWLNVKAQF